MKNLWRIPRLTKILVFLWKKFLVTKLLTLRYVIQTTKDILQNKLLLEFLQLPSSNTSNLIGNYKRVKFIEISVQVISFSLLAK